MKGLAPASPEPVKPGIITIRPSRATAESLSTIHIHEQSSYLEGDKERRSEAIKPEGRTKPPDSSER